MKLFFVIISVIASLPEAQSLEGRDLKDPPSILLITKSAMVMSGGTPGSHFVMKTVEMFLPATNTTCWLPDLPEEVMDHMTGGRGLTYCGGLDMGENKQSHCVHWRDGGWVRGAELGKPKHKGIIWSLETGNVTTSLVMGGCSYCGPASTVLVSGSSAQPGFDLQYETMSACGVEDGRNSLVYVVGGGRGGERNARQDISRITSI